MLIVPAADPELEKVLRTQMRLERLRAIRIVLLTILAFDGAMVWIDAVRPPLAHTRGGLFALMFWPLCFLFYIVVWGLEMRTQGEIDRLVARERVPADSEVL